MGISSGIDMTLFYPAGIIMDRFGRKWTAVPCIALLSLSLSLIPLTQHFEGLLLLGILAGLGNGLGSGIQMTFGSDLAPSKLSGEFLGIWRLIGDAGTMGGPLLVGVFSQILSLGLSALLTAGIGMAGAVWMIFLVAETLHTRRSYIWSQKSMKS